MHTPFSKPGKVIRFQLLKKLFLFRFYRELSSLRQEQWNLSPPKETHRQEDSQVKHCRPPSIPILSTPTRHAHAPLSPTPHTPACIVHNPAKALVSTSLGITATYYVDTTVQTHPLPLYYINLWSRARGTCLGLLLLLRQPATAHQLVAENIGGSILCILWQLWSERSDETGMSNTLHAGGDSTSGWRESLKWVGRKGLMQWLQWLLNCTSASLPRLSGVKVWDAIIVRWGGGWPGRMRMERTSIHSSQTWP